MAIRATSDQQATWRGAAPAQVGDAITHATAMKRLLMMQPDLDKNFSGEIFFRWQNWEPDCATAPDAGTSLWGEPGHRFVFQWHPAGPAGWGEALTLLKRYGDIGVTYIQHQEAVMITKLVRVTILVRDYDEALQFYTEKLGLEKHDDIPFGPGVRWVTVAPAGQADIEIVLQQPHAAMHGEEHAGAMAARVGQSPTWVFNTDDCRKTYAELQERGVHFTSAPEEQPYGVEAVFQDLYGNSFSLLQAREISAK